LNRSIPQSGVAHSRAKSGGGCGYFPEPDEDKLGGGIFVPMIFWKKREVATGSSDVAGL